MPDRDDDAPELGSADVVRAGAAAIDPLAREVARAAAARALFGRDAPVTVGRYQLQAQVGAGGMGVVWSAFDPELGRTIALKLAAAGGGRARERALTEGRALARLSHPHVVPIYDVVDAEPGVFLVMELVKGQTLRAFAGTAPGPRALIAAYREAALGLAAAHAAGLVHRDFKPDNAVIGDDRRVRVLDFGLADRAGDQRGVAGTPRYMAPEQRAGTVTAAVDQYALCVALREALGATPPRWIVPVLTRGADDDPAARFPSMDALAVALGRDPAARWRRRGVAALALVAVAAVAFALVRGRGPRAPRCDGDRALIAAAWDDGRPALASHLASLTGPYAAPASARLLTGLDDYARRWRLAFRGACHAHARGELTAAMFERRTECLTRARTALATLAHLATTAERAQLAALAEADAGLPSLVRCNDDDALASPVAPPPPELRAAVASIDLQLTEAAVWRDAGTIERARAEAARAVTAADALGYPPLIARARHARGRIELAAAAGDRGAEDFATATGVALSAGDDALAVEAFARLAYARATAGKTAAAVDGLTLIAPLAGRLPPRDAFAVALLEGNLGAYALAHGDRAAARPHFDRAATMSATVDGPGALELSSALLGQALLLDDPAAARARVDAQVARMTDLVGAEHPQTLRLQIVRAQLEDDPAAARAALAGPCAALAHQHPELGARYAACASELALAAAIVDDAAALRRWAELAIIAGDHDARPLHAARARAYLLLADGDARAALAALRTVRATLRLGPTTPWFETINALDTEVAIAIAARRAGDAPAATAALVEARALLTQVDAAVPPAIAMRTAAVLDALARP